MQPQEPGIDDPGEAPSTPATEIIDDPGIPDDAPVDDVYDPPSEGPDIVD